MALCPVKVSKSNKQDIGDEPDGIKLLMYAKGRDEENQEAIDNP